MSSATNHRAQELLAAEAAAAEARFQNEEAFGGAEGGGHIVNAINAGEGGDEDQAVNEEAAAAAARQENDDDDGGAEDVDHVAMNPDGFNNNMLLPILGQHDDGRMEITAVERRDALAIKEAIGNDPEINQVSDFMCAQLALILGDDIETALERALHLQHFQEEYDIKDTLDDGVRCFLGLVQLFPQFHLSFSYNSDQGNYVMVYDMACFDLRLLKSEKQIRNWLGGSYYTLTVFCPDMEAIRRGAILINECEGYDWKINMNFKTLRRVWSEVAAVYPVWWKQFKYFNSGTTFNLVASMLRSFLPAHARDKLEFGCQFERRLDELYLVPNADVANDRLMGRFMESLNRRYQNEKNFRL